jgi:hypothetical protein
MLRHCSECDSDKPIDEFGRASKFCRACARERRKRSLRLAQARWVEKNGRSESNRKFYGSNRKAQRARAKAWRDANPERRKAAAAAYRSANPESVAASRDRWKAANPEHRARYRKERYKAIRERELSGAREWKRRNPARCTALNAKRLAAQLRATPAWADAAKIDAFYAEAARLTREAGVEHHVDHIIPLQSKWVCGLHVHTNLQILSATENQSKSNRIWPDALKDHRS